MRAGSSSNAGRPDSGQADGGRAAVRSCSFIPHFDVEHRQKLLQLAGGALSAEEAGRTLGITRQAVDKRRRANTLLAVREGSDWRYPACQFHQGEILPGIADVVQGFASAGPWAAPDFLLASDTVLEGDTPLQVLQSGDRDRVLRLVHSSQGDGFS